MERWSGWRGGGRARGGRGEGGVCTHTSPPPGRQVEAGGRMEARGQGGHCSRGGHLTCPQQKRKLEEQEARARTKDEGGQMF